MTCTPWGRPTTAAKIEVYGDNGFWGDLVETFVLFGDPATELGLAPNYPYLLSTSPADGTAGRLVEPAGGDPVQQAGGDFDGDPGRDRGRWRVVCAGVE